jgi:hypothetical protein
MRERRKEEAMTPDQMLEVLNTGAGLIISTSQVAPQDLPTLANSAAAHGGTLTIRGPLGPQTIETVANAGQHHVVFDVSLT